MRPKLHPGAAREGEAQTSHLFRSLHLVLDQAHDGPLNMAIDQVLLDTAVTPVLRIYGWAQATVSIGYRHSLDSAQTMLGCGQPIVRRWTGGGIVHHGEDTTYSLIVPASDAWAKTRPAASYQELHSRLAEALNSAGHGPCRLAAGQDLKEGVSCFDSPALSDILRGNRKLAGAGQRRTRVGLLHQGSMMLKLEAGFWRTWAATLAREVTESSLLTPNTLVQARKLASTRYGSSSWLNKDL